LFRQIRRSGALFALWGQLDSQKPLSALYGPFCGFYGPKRDEAVGKGEGIIVFVAFFFLVKEAE
jgi:hypothetical protein